MASRPSVLAPCRRAGRDPIVGHGQQVCQEASCPVGQGVVSDGLVAEDRVADFGAWGADDGHVSGLSFVGW